MAMSQRVPFFAKCDERLLEMKLTKALESYTFEDTENGFLLPICCAVCDGIPTSEFWWEAVEIDKFSKLCSKCNLYKTSISNYYNSPGLLEDYTVEDERLCDYVLSPGSIIDKTCDTIIVCKSCKKDMDDQSGKKKKHRKPPMAAIINGYLLGKTPKELEDLTDMELAIVSDIKTYCQTWVFFGGCHQHIKGWHTFYKNRVVQNVSQVQQLRDAGINGQLVVVLCGPFTTTQKALVYDKATIRSEKIIAAFQWLKKNNIWYKDMIIPGPDDIPKPIIINDLE